MVEVTAAVIAYCGTDGLWNFVDAAHNLPNRAVIPFGGAFKGFVEVGYIRRMVLIVMDFHRAGIDRWFKRIESIFKGWKFKHFCHVPVLSISLLFIPGWLPNGVINIDY